MESDRMAAAAEEEEEEEEEGQGEAPAPAPFSSSSSSSSSSSRPSKLPLSRVKALVKADPDVTLASQEAVYVLARAAELFVETIAKDAFVYAQRGKRKTLQRKDLDKAIEAMDEFAFLEGTLD
ncbi:hypothetical protein JRQ81_008694 [Phrynocephalus forsythii]|uniref:DNA polymerase epsilon subunit 4 n=1 Tax=Phrynocephalus forsythii TaxID=171643 RepID=A0A9Q0XB09_9SAUR|nr:hypothetical protein JRQ81_008694 [Phrynocephalus forsythii]